MTTSSVPAGEVRLLGDRAFLIGVTDAAAARALAAALTAALGDAVETVSGSATVLVHVTEPDAERSDLVARAEVVREGWVGGAAVGRPDGPGRVVTIPCRFDGPDLEAVAAQAGCGPDEVVRLLTGQDLTAAVVGFSPGFAYLEGLPAPLRQVARRDRPRPVVPAGSVAIANGHAAVYPTASPGGWHLLGRTGVPLFTPDQRPYAVLAPGDRVRFRAAEADEPAEPGPVAAPVWVPPAGSRAVWEVLAPGLRAVVQDGGRCGVAGAGVPAAGPADVVSFALANRLVGNAPGAGTVELTGGGARLRCVGACHVAVVGAAPDVRIDGNAVPPGQVLPLAAGQSLEVGRQRGGCRSYVAVAGGVLGPEWFGSSATDELTGLGAGALRPGQVVLAGSWAPPLGDHVVAGGGTSVLDGSSVAALRLLPGPHRERFEADALERAADVVFVVQSDSNRVGLRLRPEPDDDGGLRQRDAGVAGLDSQGVVTGAVQVPPDGNPVVLGPDHATLGGYPVLGVVIAADHGLLGQCAPGQRLCFVPVGVDEADEARREARRDLARAVVGTFPLAVD